MITVVLSSVAQTRRLARVLAGLLAPPMLVTVAGDLGTGKTTLVREILRARGVRGAITSPSFTLAQSYRGREGEDLHHLDLYRLTPGADVELFAWGDYAGSHSLTFVEWPAAGTALLSTPDVIIELEHRTLRTRRLRLCASTSFETALMRASAAVGLRVDDARPVEDA
ncbi:MAG: tRNA (adenosine(37)-N6)-threonylcarbamoyltransferase complex ATPase subunit type 1 TsaE [Thermoleophilia bacterium]